MSRIKALCTALALTLALAAPPAHAASAGFEGPRVEGSGIAQWLDSTWGWLTSLFTAKHRGTIDPDGQPAPCGAKHRGAIDPNGQPAPRGGEIDPDGDPLSATSDDPFSEPDHHGHIDPDGKP